MTPELKAKWIAALRSGNYKQGRGQLRDLEDNYCCLGVLCDVAGLEWTRKEIDYWVGDHCVTVPVSLGLRPEPHAACVRMNDFEKLTFGQIADWLECHI